jgi:dihydrofolate reductase
MGCIVACINLTLDGVMQAPARADEDERDGFTHGGWGAKYGAMAAVGHVFGNTDALLLGRRTYTDFATVWPARPDSPFTPWLTQIPKHVVSHTLREPLPWANSMLVRGDVIGEVRALRQATARDILIMGSGELLRSLLRAELVDELVLLVHPLVLGAGRRLFGESDSPIALDLVSSSALPNGVLVATYHPARR